MSNEIEKPKPQASDNFGCFDDAIESGGDDDGYSGGSVLAGLRLKFTNGARWIIATSKEDVTGRELVAINVRRTEVYWGQDGRPTDKTRELGPGERYRDLDAINDALPRSEWRVDQNGKPQGPWQRQHVLEFVDLNDMQRYSWPTNTIGGTRCINDLRDRILLMRRFRGENTYPTVRLADTFMPTTHGGRQRPHLDIKGWIKIGPDAEPALPRPVAPVMLPKAAPPTEVPAAEAAAAATAKEQPDNTPAVKTEKVSEPSLAEEMRDELPY
jgi:hypothetical protein